MRTHISHRNAEDYIGLPTMWLGNNCVLRSDIPIIDSTLKTLGIIKRYTLFGDNFPTFIGAILRHQSPSNTVFVLFKWHWFCSSRIVSFQRVKVLECLKFVNINNNRRSDEQCCGAVLKSETLNAWVYADILEYHWNSLVADGRGGRSGEKKSISNGRNISLKNKHH